MFVLSATEDIARQISAAGKNRQMWGDYAVNVRLYGAKGSGNTDDTAAIQKCFNDSAGKTVFFPDGVYSISQKLSLLAETSLIMSPNARIVAIAPMDKMIETPAAQFTEHAVYKGGILDCNNLADIGIHLQFMQEVEVRDMVVLNNRVAAYKIGSSGATSNTYGVFMANCRSHRTRGVQCLPGSYGLLLENCSDSHFTDCAFVGNETGCNITTGNNHLIGVHVWNHPSHGELKWGFIIQNAAHLTNCMADTCTVYGFWIKGFNTIMINNRIFNGPFGPVTPEHPTGKWDNVMIGIYCENDFHTIVGTMFSGSGSDTRIAQDVYLQPDKENVTVIGSVGFNVAINNSRQRITGLYAQGNIQTRDQLITENEVVITGPAGDQRRAVLFQRDGSTKWRFGSDGTVDVNGDFGLGLYAYPEGVPSFEVLWFNRATGDAQFRKNLSVNSGILQCAGTYQQPFRLGNYSLWVDAAGKLRILNGLPASDLSGTVVGTQT